ncbi:MAG: hypothetical protein ACRDOU_02605 [Streptosporangiaceae bacterium]
MVLTVLDALGYGLLMTALTLRLASIGAVVHVFNMTIMFFGGMFIPITLFPHGVQIFARFVPSRRRPASSPPSATKSARACCSPGPRSCRSPWDCRSSR